MLALAAVLGLGCAPRPAAEAPKAATETPSEGPQELVSCVRDLGQDLEPSLAGVLALRAATWTGDGARVKACLDEGVDPNLAWPGAARWYELTRLVLEAGASPHGPEGEPCPACVAEAVAVDSCPLCDAARHGSPEVVSLLLASGADPDAPDGPSGRRPLHLAAQRHAIGVVRALLEGGADVDARDSEGRTALMYAVVVLSEDLAAVLRLLVDAGADTTMRDDEGRSALDHARDILGEHASAIDELLTPR